MEKLMIDKKKKLLEAAKELFVSKGFKSTNVAAITRLAGVATGTYYNYYQSKDQLFMEIYLTENHKLKKKIIESIDLSGHPMYVMGEMMRLNSEGMKKNPILNEWYNRESFSKIENNFRESNGLGEVDFMYDLFLDVVRQWQKEKKMRNDIAPEMIMAIFKSLVNVETHKDEIGFQYFPEVLNHLSSFVMNGLMEHK